MSKNLGEINQLEDGLNGLYQYVESYKKIKSVTGEQSDFLEEVLGYYEFNKRILEGLKMTKKDLKQLISEIDKSKVLEN